MGETYTFTCDSCGYEAEVAGGLASGLLMQVETIVCFDCAQLYDVVVGERSLEIPQGFDPCASGQAGGEELDFYPPVDEGFLAVPACCPVSEDHSWQRWVDPGVCPRCGEEMVKDPLVLLHWD